MQTNTRSGYTRVIQNRIERAYQSYSTLTGPSTIDVQFPG